MSKSTNTLEEGNDPIQVSPNPFKKRVRIQFDLEYNGDAGKVMDGKSQTIPDFNLTVRQLIENHTRGHDDSTLIKQPLYFETEIPQIHDITDVAAYKEHLMERMQEIDNFIKSELDDKPSSEAPVANPTETAKTRTPDPQPSDTSTKRDKDPSAQP